MKQKRLALLIVALVWTLFACSGTMQDCTGFIGRSGADYFVVTEDATGEDVGFLITEETELRIEALAAKEHGIDSIVAGLFVTVALGEPAERPEGFIGKSPTEELAWYCARTVTITDVDPMLVLPLG